ncbi:BTB/POZ domain-containing protein 6-like [Mizuhopecten yessoensis]|uniref:BTB/POZ domain-containing protein 6 n=1 Tax=Mizuhopecten yessoensis TaxID=6573 RepID=A0A210QXA7_MIZYE|nr:BTB/POZ domain-containing protein 6-like [Mizuhopecten yessoensis]OWF53341.1 BTB/POZ domain-containing protein 6 [Mizuhopecten yessoensis]
MTTAQAQERSWQCDKSLVECLNHLFTSGIACDVTFLVGESKHRIPAHKTILISRSPVFYAMFEGNLAEKGEIAIPDIEQEVFTMFLWYLYTDTIELTVNTATSVLSAARKYMVDRLVKNCETFLKSSLTTENVCLLLEQAHIYTEEGIKEDCVNMIARSPEEVLKSTSFVDLCGVCVKSITEPDDLAVEESVVYEAVMRWSEAECGRQGLEVTDTNRREVLGDIIYTVRFPIIDAKYLSQHVIMTDVLTSEQLVSVMRFQQDNKAYHCTEFSVNQRKVREPIKGIFECISRFTGTVSGFWNTRGVKDSDSISFVDMFLHGLQLYQTDQNVIIGVYSPGGHSLYKESHTVLTNETLCNTEFHHIIKITRDHTYTVVLYGGVRTMAYGEQGFSTVKCRDGQIRFMASLLFPCRNTTVDRGQIPRLLVSF